MRILATAIVMLLPALLPGAEIQSSCEPSGAVRQELKRLQLLDLKGQEREQAQKKIVQELLTEHPDDLFIHLRYQRIFRGHTEADRQAVIDRYQRLAESDPGDSQRQFLYAEALLGKDTPRSIELANKIIETRPGFARAHLLLADIYSWGKLADRRKTQQQLDSFFQACPATLDSDALALAKRYGNLELAAKLAPALRKRLESETDPDLLKSWETVWNFEFKAHPVTEHDQVRKQMFADLQRLQSANPTGNASWLAFLRNGYRAAGNETAAKEQESKLLAEYPDSQEARQLSDELWYKEHPWPGSDEAKQKEYWQASLARAEHDLKKSPNSENLLMMRFNAMSNLQETPVDRLTAAADAMLAEAHKDLDMYSIPPFEMRVAQAYVKRKIRVDQVPQLVEEGWASFRRMSMSAPSDRDPDNLRKGDAANEAYVTRQAASILLDAAQQLNKSDIAKEAIAKVEALKPDKPFEKSSQFEIEAKWAELHGRKLDAFLLYRAAIDTRTDSPRPPKKDELAENMDRLWKDLGGTDASSALLAKSAPAEATKEGRWEKPDKEMKSWQLTDLNGKTWKLASLEGKTMLINVWASWCGPCKAEHPHLQKLYERIKSDPNIGIVTFNIDDEIGNVAPYIKENKYTFPVLLAKDYADELSVDSIPRNWIIDAKGKWQWQQIGFGSEDKWEDEMLAKIKETK